MSLLFVLFIHVFWTLLSSRRRLGIPSINVMSSLSVG